MANTIRDYSATPANNTVVDGADISEGCSPAGINDAIRGVMADLKDVSTGAVALESPAMDSLTVTGNVGAATFSGDGSALTGIPTPTLTSLGIANHDDITVDASGNVGIGTTTNNQSSSTASVTLNAASGMSAYELRNADVFSGYVGHTGTNMYLVNAKNGSLGLYTNNAERMHLTAAGNVGIGTTSPVTNLHIAQAGNAGNNYKQGSIKIGSTYGVEIGYNGLSSGRASFTSLNNAGTTNNRMSFGFGAITSGGEPTTNVMTLNQAGHVTMPYQPFALVDFGGGSYASMSGTLPFDNIFQNQGNHYNTSTYKFTCPVAGVYRVSGKIITENNSDVGHMNLHRNGTVTMRSYTVSRGWSGDFTIYCAANDTLHLSIDTAQVYQDIGSSRYSWASYYLLG